MSQLTQRVMATRQALNKVQMATDTDAKLKALQAAVEAIVGVLEEVERNQPVTLSSYSEKPSDGQA